MAVVCALQPIPNQGAHTGGDLFSVALIDALLASPAASFITSTHLLVDGALTKGMQL